LELAQARQTFSAERILWLTGLGVAISMLGDITLYVVLPTHTAQAGIALADVGLMLSANRAIRIFINSPYGMLIERLPRRMVMLFSIIIGTVSTLLYTVPGFWPLLVGRLLWGIAWAGVWMGGSTIVLDIAHHRNRGRFVGRLQMWGFIGQGAAALVGGLLTDWLGYSSAFYVFAALSVLMGAVWWLFLPETRHQPSPPTPLPQGEGSKTTQASAGLTPHSIHGAGEKSREALSAERSTASLVVAVLVMGMNWLVFLGALMALLSLLLQQRVGSVIVLAGVIIPLATFTGGLSAGVQTLGLLSAPLCGWLSDRTGNRWGLVAGALVVGIVCLLVVNEGSGLAVVAAILVSGVVTSILQTQAVTIAGDQARANRQGRIIGVLNTAGDIGSAAGPYLAFLLLPVIGMNGIFTLLVALLLLLLPWVLWMAWREAAVSFRLVADRL
jgi:MFS family permease